MATVQDSVNVELVPKKSSNDISLEGVPIDKVVKSEKDGEKGDEKEKPANHIIDYHEEIGNKKSVRLMPNGHWSIPFSVAFVMKKLKDFQPENLSIEVSLTIIMRLKFTGLPEI